MESLRTIKDGDIPFLKNPVYRGFRLRIGQLLYYSNNPAEAPADTLWSDYQTNEREITNRIPYICGKLSEEERNELNLAYIAFLRIRGLIRDGEAVSYNLVGQAVKWKLEREYTDYLQSKEHTHHETVISS